MSYNLSKYPNDVANLFEPNGPLQFKKPTDYPISKRKTIPNISPLSNYINNNVFSQYKKEFPKGTPNKHLTQYSKIKRASLKNHIMIQDELKKWSPENDPNLANTDPYKTIFVGRLPYDVTEIELQKTFSKFGDIEKLRVVRNREGKPRGYGFIVFTDANFAKIATREIGVHRGIYINDRKCIVDIERGRTVKYFKPRRLGGGLGGRGYTKQTFDDYNTDRGYIHERDNSGHSDWSDPSSRPSRFSGNRSTAYTGTSRFNRSEEEQTAISQNVQTSYKSRTMRTRDTTTASKTEVPDY